MPEDEKPTKAEVALADELLKADRERRATEPIMSQTSILPTKLEDAPKTAAEALAIDRSMEPPAKREESFSETAYNLRTIIKEIAAKTMAMRGRPWPPHPDEQVKSDPNEMAANITLAYRHLEDAAMRLGKAVQAFDGGQSIYPR